MTTEHKFVNFSIGWWNIWVSIGRFSVWFHFPWSWFEHGWLGFLSNIWAFEPDDEFFWGRILGIEYCWSHDKTP